jgi:hypothetical protein
MRVKAEILRTQKVQTPKREVIMIDCTEEDGNIGVEDFKGFQTANKI